MKMLCLSLAIVFGAAAWAQALPNSLDNLKTIDLASIAAAQKSSPRIGGLAPGTLLIPDWVGPNQKGKEGDFLYQDLLKPYQLLKVPYNGCRVYLADGAGLAIDVKGRAVAYAGGGLATLLFHDSSISCAYDLESVKPKDPSSGYFSAYLEDPSPSRIGKTLARLDAGMYYFFAMDGEGNELVFFRIQSVESGGLVLWLFF